jgi:aryl-alcohol dehydrogenase-like predicted oxidoreductase
LAPIARQPAELPFALLNPMVATVLFGATKPGQVGENVAAVDLKALIDRPTLERLRTIGA